MRAGFLALLFPLAIASGPAPRAAVWTTVEGESRIGFLLHTFWHGVEGTTTALDGVLESAGGDPREDGIVRIIVESAGLETGVERRDQKMREEHLDVETYPLIAFQSTAPPGAVGGEQQGAGSPGGRFLQITGDLTLHGVTRQVTIPVEVQQEPDGWLMKAGFSLLLSEYRIPDPSIFMNRVRDEVDVYFEIRFASSGTRRESAPIRAHGPAGDQAVTIYLVRHAERGIDDPRDPHLTEAGRRRAEALDRMLRDAPVTHLFSTEFHRTLETLAPLSERTGVEVAVIPGRAIQDQVDRLRRLEPGAVAVVAGHSNTIPWIVRALGGEATGLESSEHGEILSDSAYDRLFVVILGVPAAGGGRRTLTSLELRYGAPTP